MATSSTQLQHFLYLVARLLLVYLILGFVSSFSASAQVSGVVFRDFNANGTRETLEVGVASVTVTATFSGTIATAVSTTTGAYSFNAATIPSGTAVRLEFRTNVANDYSGPVTTSSGGNRSSVQFVTAGSGTTTANYAVNQPSDYCQATPDLITNCYVNGAVNGTGIGDVVVKWPYSNSGTSTTGKSTVSTKSQSGSTWGLGYDRNQKKIYAAAFLKRHAGLLDNNADGFGDLGAIYQIDPATSANNLWLDIITLGVNVGSIGNDAARGLSNTGAPSNDPTSYSLVGQVGLGDLDISDDNTTMYVVNLNQQELVVIDIATKALLGKYTIPNPGCTGGSPRPFGVKYYRGAVYVGVICDAATSQLKNNLSATVYRFNGSSFTSVLTFPLTYPKGIPIISSCPNQTGWYPWVATLPAPCEGNAISYPQPILSDIEFDTDGSMILGFIDRNAHQGGWGNYGPTGNTLYYHINGGDILRAALVNGNFVLENGGVAGTLTGNTTNNQGPGGGEFYQGDNFSNVVNVPHEETSLGGLALIPGRGEVAVTSMDPINEAGSNQYSSGGVIFLSNTNGSKQRSFRVYSNTDLGTFGKAAGLGDLEALCDPAPIQIGNRVWRDNNRNGIQDPGEPAIPGAVVTLYDATGTTAIASVTTNAAGEYYFSSTTLTTGTSTSSVATSALLPNTNYALVVTSLGTSTVVNGLSLSSVSPMTPGEATSANSGSTTTNNDALSVGGRPTIQLTTGPPGSVNHTYDFGFVIPGGNLGDFVWDDANRNGQQDAGEPGIPGVTVTLLSSGTLVVTTTTDASGLYSFTGLTPGVPYSVSFTAPVGYSATLQNVGSDLTDSDGNPVTGLTGVYSLTADEFNRTVDMGYYRPASLGDFVWVDVNQNGQQDAGEPGIPGVTVTLLSSGTVVATTTTNASGLYSFTGLTPGVPYSVSFTTPTNYTATLSNVGNDLTDSDPVGGVTAPVTLTSGENNTSLDAGFILQVASLGDFVFEDANRNGQQDAGEPGIPGVTVTLLSSGTVVATTTANASGLYSFTGLTPSVPYSVSFTAPAGYSATLQNIGSDLTDSDGNPVTGLTGVYSLTADEFNRTVDMGYYRPASLGDFVWVDVNQNGQQDADEPGLPGVVVTLLDGTNTPIASTTTNASGLYSFTGLTPGVPYSVSFTTPVNYTATLANVGNDLTDSDPVGGVTAPVTLTSGENNTSLDAGFILRVASLGDFVWEDANRNGQQDVGEPGIPGVTVTLLSSGTLVATTTTDASGLYSFTGLTPGVPYSVSFTAPVGYSATLQNVGSDLTDSDGNPVTGLTGVYSLTANEFNPTVDMGYYRPASLGDFVWEDVNQNGQQDAGEPGIPNVTVTLLSSGTVVATTTTNASGLYSFTGLTPGVPYSVSFTTPTNYTATLSNVGNDLTDSDPVGGVTAPLTLTSGENNTSLDAGFLLQTASLGDFVFEDANRNGQQDAGEPGIPGVTVTLLSSGTLVATTTTDASGLYSFTGLTPGVPYSVSFTAPAGYSATLQNVGSDLTDSDGNPVTGLTGVYSLTADEFNRTVDMGYYRPASLGDFVWVDVNQNGQQDADEPGLPGVVVTLLDGTNTPIASTTTNASGLYSFTGLTPGIPYSVSFTTPTNYTATLSNVGNDLTDSDPVGGVTAPVTLTSGENNTSLDAGFILQTASLGDFVFEDANRNGQQDVGEPGILGVTVTLLSSDTLVATTTTDASGLYSFTGLTPGVPYSVSFTAPAGYSATLQNVGSDLTDSDGNPVTGLTGVYSLTANEFNPSVDMGYYRPASLGDFVWVDVNQNGQQDAGEPGLPGVVVTLLDGTNTLIASTTTNASGLYSFTGLTPGIPYSVSFTTPTNYTATLSNVGNDLTDSDPVGGVTAPVTLTSGENNTSLDAGFILQTAGLGDFVFEDANRNGRQDAGEPGIPNVTVSLLSSGTLVATTTTNASGLYSFTGLTPGVPYSVSFTAPAGYSATLQNVGSDLTDSDGNPVTGLTGVYSLTANEFNPTVDMGYYRPASLGDFVWVDVNQNGQQDAGEPGLPGVVVTLLDGTNTPIASTTTNASGLYSFTGLTPGVPYSVSFTTPTNYTATLSNVGNDLTDSDPVGGVTAPVTLTSGENNTNVDAGFYSPSASLGDFVWVDTNQNGQQDVGEPGLPGVVVVLLDGTNSPIASTTTNASGIYSFTGLTPGIPYSVSLVAPTGYTATIANVGGDDTKDSDVNPMTGQTQSVTLTPGENNTNLDAGFVSTTVVAPVLSLQKLVSLSKANLGDLLTYTLVVSNTGSTSANTTVRDSLGTGASYVANSASFPASTSFTVGNPVSLWNIPVISAGQSLSMTYQVRIDSTGIIYNSSTIPGDTAKVCTSVSVTICMGQEYVLTATAGRTSYNWYRNGVLITDQTTNVLTITEAGSYSLAPDNTSGQCADFSCCPFIVEMDSLPAFQTRVIPATCLGTNVQANGQIILSNFKPGLQYQYSAGGTFNPAASLSGAPKVIPADGVLVSTLGNPATPQMYTVRVYNRLGCYVDQTVILITTVCGCPADACIPFVIKQIKRPQRIGTPR